MTTSVCHGKWVASFWGVTVYRLQSCYNRMKKDKWQPRSPCGWLFGCLGKKADSAEEVDLEQQIPSLLERGGADQGRDDIVDPALANIVRCALASIVEGQSFAAYRRQLQRMKLADGDVGSKYCDRRFATEIIALASLVLRQLDAYDWNQPLPGLGIPSDFAILADPVSLGVSVRARHDVLLVTCICLASRRTGTLYSPMFAAPAMPFGSHGGDTMASLMLETFTQHPAGWGLHVLRSRCSSLCGDGALCIGGPEHRHKSSDAVGKFWRKIHADPIVAYPNGPHVNAPECCCWDPFHRADNAGWRAIKAVPDAVKVFDISKQLDYAFGTSEGVTLFRGVADLVDERPYNIRAPGGTRKIVYLSGSPSSIIENYRIIMASLHGRVAWVQQGHSTQKIGHLLELARTLSDPQFVTFTLLLSDILTTVVQPFAKQVQAACEPAVFYGAQLRFRREILDGLMFLGRIRKLMRVVCLCRQHAPIADLSNFLQAFLSQRGQRYTQFKNHIAGIILPPAARHGDVDNAAPLFMNTRLVYPPARHDRSQEMCIGPHCQCPSKIAFHKKLWHDLIDGRAVAADQEREDARPIIQVNCRGRRRATRVPVPVAFPCDSPQPEPTPLVNIAPRFSFLPRVANRPPNLNMQRMLRARISHTRDGDLSRCQVPYNAYLLHEAVDAALCSAVSLLEKLNMEFDAILHSVGCNVDMSALLQNSAACWDWSTLIFQRPSVQQVLAFKKVIEMLRPLLIRTYFPTGDPFGGVSPYWPDDSILCRQYMKLAQRVRDAAAGDLAVPEEVRNAAREWVHDERIYFVRPLWVNRVVEQICRQHAKDRVWTCCLRPAALISCYADMLPLSAYDVWELPSEQLQPRQRCVVRRRRRGKRKRCTSPPASRSRGGHLKLGELCVHPINKRKALMYVEARKVVVDIARVAATLDLQPWFHVGMPGTGMVAWHAGRVHHRCRLLFPPDTSCEGTGSHLRLAWDTRQGQASPVYVSDRAFLMQAGVQCVGGERDELLVREVCRLLQITSKYKVSAGSKADAGSAPFVRAQEKPLPCLVDFREVCLSRTPWCSSQVILQTWRVQVRRGDSNT